MPNPTTEKQQSPQVAPPQVAPVQEQQTTQAPGAGGNAQADYNRQMAQQAQGKPIDRARAALKTAGLPIGQMLPDDLADFSQKPDGTIALKLAKEKKIPLGDITLVLGTSITGKLGAGTLSAVTGIKGQKKIAFITASANITKLTRAADELIVNTDSSSAAEVKVKLSSLGES